MSTSPLRGIPFGMIQSKAEIRSVATNSKRLPKSKISRTLPLLILRTPGKSRWSRALFVIRQNVEGGVGGSKRKMEWVGTNPKAEIRNPKEIRSPKLMISSSSEWRKPLMGGQSAWGTGALQRLRDFTNLRAHHALLQHWREYRFRFSLHWRNDFAVIELDDTVGEVEIFIVVRNNEHGLAARF